MLKREGFLVVFSLLLFMTTGVMIVLDAIYGVPCLVFAFLGINALLSICAIIFGLVSRKGQGYDEDS
jgi:hypothetical protein